MRYLDSGSRDPTHALAAWLRNVLTDDVAALRWQSGFFALDGVGELQATLTRLSRLHRPVHALVGSNDGATLATHVFQLMQAIEVPRPGGHLGVIRYANGFFHPKVYHVCREDGSQAAYVGSANLTGAGVASLHVEAGISIDTRDGDSAGVLTEIAQAIDAWFANARGGFNLITGAESVDSLVALGVLAEVPPPLRPAESGTDDSRDRGRTASRLRALIDIIEFRHSPDMQTGDGFLVLDGEATPLRSDESDAVAVPLQPQHFLDWEIVWKSSALAERDLSIPTAEGTNPTGSMLLKRGAWERSMDFRHYFRDEVFRDLEWHRNETKLHLWLAEGEFEIIVDGVHATMARLSISHNGDVTSATYAQRNGMTSLRWGEAKAFVARRELLGGRLELDREVGAPAGRQPKFRIRVYRKEI